MVVTSSLQKTHLLSTPFRFVLVLWLGLPDLINRNVYWEALNCCHEVDVCCFFGL